MKKEYITNILIGIFVLLCSTGIGIILATTSILLIIYGKTIEIIGAICALALLFIWVLPLIKFHIRVVKTNIRNYPPRIPFDFYG